VRAIEGKQLKTITIEGFTMYTERRTYATDVIVQHERRTYSADLKAQVALAAIKNEKSPTELALEFGVQPSLVCLWKEKLLNNLSRIFDDECDTVECSDKSSDNCHAKIGQLTVENDFLTKVLGRQVHYNKQDS
jgi:transposase